MKKYFVFFTLMIMLMHSCSVTKEMKTVETKKTERYANYSVRLTSVELPANAKERYGNIITVDQSKNEISKYIYEDSYIKIKWFFIIDRFYFTLYNKSDHALKVIWDDAALVMTDTSISRLMHEGTKYSQRNETQLATTIPRGAKIEDQLVPVNNVIYSESFGWDVRPMFINTFESDSAMEEANLLKGRTMSILLPIKIEDVQNEYTFVFTIDVVTEKTTKTETNEIEIHDEKAEKIANIIAGGVIGTIVGAIIYILLFSSL